ncbi:MAG: TonB-dependent receptor [Candidatus Zixiibacteriota bacterium]
MSSVCEYLPRWGARSAAADRRAVPDHSPQSRLSRSFALPFSDGIGGRVGRRAFFLFVAFVVTAPATARAESERAISGTVYDRASGSPLEGAVLTVDGTAWASITDAGGRFSMRSIPPGEWSVMVTRVGFQPRHLASVAVREGFEQTLHISLIPAPVVLPGQQATGQAPDRFAVRRIELSSTPQSPSQTIEQALARVPGVRVYGSSETPGGVRVSVGGEPAERVAVLLDGVPLSGGGDGSVDLAAIPPAAIRAIEVHPGSQSAIAGNAAVGGVVNLITSTDDPAAAPPTELHAFGGAFDHYEAGTSQRLLLGGGEARFTLDGFRHGPRFSYPSGDTNAIRTGVASHGLRVFTRFDNLPRHIEALAFVYRSTNGVPGPLEQRTPDATNDNDRFRCQVRWQAEMPEAMQAAAAIWYENGREHYRSPQLYKADAESNEETWGGKADLVLHGRSLSGGLTVEMRSRRLEGIDHLRPAQSFGVRQRMEHAVRGQVAHSGSLPIGSGTARVTWAWDIETGGQSILSPRADLSWSGPGAIVWHGGWGRSFRRPELTSLFWKADAYAVGNPDLRPERASEWDIAVGWFPRRVVAETRYFERDVTDIIVWDRDFAGRYTPRNLRAASVVGREDHIAVVPCERLVSLTLDYTHVFTGANDASGEPNTDGRTLVFTPRHIHQFRLSGEWRRFGATVLGRWVSLRYTRRANTKTIAPYRAFDASVTVVCRRRAPRLTVSLSGENLTNEHIELIERYPSPGRALSGAITVGL